MPRWLRAIDLLARSGQAVVLATLAGNHRDELARHPLLAVLQHPHRTIALSEPDEPHLRRLIREPMERAGGTIDEGFVQCLLAGRAARWPANDRGACPCSSWR